MELGLADKVVLVTGSYRGTGSGIAAGIAREGARVLVHGFEPGQADPIAEAIVAEGHLAEAVVGDITTDDGADELVESIRRRDSESARQQMAALVKVGCHYVLKHVER